MTPETYADSIGELSAENLQLRWLLSEVRFSGQLKDLLLERWAAFAGGMLARHRASLPSEAADLYGGGCGCPQCQIVLDLLAARR